MNECLFIVIVSFGFGSKKCSKSDSLKKKCLLSMEDGKEFRFPTQSAFPLSSMKHAVGLYHGVGLLFSFDQ